MENKVYERDYTEESEQNQWDSSGLVENMIESGFIKYWGAFKNQIPKYIVAEDKATYERILKRCNTIAKERHGKVYGIVSYEKWEAKIKLTLPFIEFTSYEDLNFLMDLSESVQTICFQPVNDEVSMSILINYFNEVDIDEISEIQLLEIAREAAVQVGIDQFDKQAIADLKDKITAYKDNMGNE